MKCSMTVVVFEEKALCRLCLNLFILLVYTDLCLFSLFNNLTTIVFRKKYSHFIIPYSITLHTCY